MKKYLHLTAVALLAGSVVSTPASAVVLFSDDFSGGLANWSIAANSPTSITAFNVGGANGNVMWFYKGDNSNPDGTATSIGTVINSAGYGNLLLSFDYRGSNAEHGNDGTETLAVQWQTDPAGAWNTIGTVSTSGTSNFLAFAPTAIANGGSDINIRFVVNMQDETFWGIPIGHDFFKIDNVRLTGDLLTTTGTSPVPLPAAGWMFLGGIAGLGMLARRRKRQAQKSMI